MRRLTLCLNALTGLRESSGAIAQLQGAAVLAELAGVDALRLGIGEALRPVHEGDIQALRRSARSLELRMVATPTLLKVALEARPDRIVLSADGFEDALRPIDPRTRAGILQPMLRSLEEAGIPTHLCVTPRIDAVKAAHQLGVAGVELYTGALVDLPPREQRSELERMGDAARLAAKLEIDVAIAGDLHERALPEFLAAAPSVARVVLGSAAVGRALLVGMDRAARDLLALIA